MMESRLRTVVSFIKRKAGAFFTGALLITPQWFCKELNLNYLTIAMVIGVVLLSFLVPDLSKVFRGSREVNEIHKIVELLTEKVKDTEDEFLSLADNVCHLHYKLQMAASGEEDLSHSKLPPVCTRSSQLLLKIHKEEEENEGGLLRRIFFPAKKSTSRKEIALMSFVYSNSFNGNRHSNSSMELEKMPSEIEIARLSETIDI